MDEPYLAQSPDRWFRPVFGGVGPDGCVYMGDWYDTRLSHVRPVDDWHKESGRVYRIRPAEAKPKYSHGDLAKLESDKLIALFSDPNRWVRRRAVLEPQPADRRLQPLLPLRRPRCRRRRACPTTAPGRT